MAPDNDTGLSNKATPTSNSSEENTDYGKISPALETLLDEVNRGLELSEPEVYEESGDGERCGGHDCLMVDFADQDGGLNTHGARSLRPLPMTKPRIQSCVNDEGNLGKCYPMISPLAPELAIMGSQQRLELECAVRTPTNYVHAFQIPIHGSVSSIRAKRQKLYLEESSSPLEMEFRKHDEKISAIKNQITRIKILETPVLTNFQAALSLEDNMLLDLEGTPSKIAAVPNTEHIGVRDNNCENNLINTAESPRSNQMFNLKPSGFDTPSNGNHNEKDMVVCGIVKSAVTTPTFQLVESGINVNRNSLVAQKPIDRTSSPNAHHSSRRQMKVELQKNREEGYFTSGSQETFRSELNII